MRQTTEVQTKEKRTAGLSIVCFVVVAFSILAGIVGVRELQRLNDVWERTAQSERATQEAHNQMVDELNRVLAESQRAQSPEYIEEYARKELGMVRSQDIIYKTQ